MKKSMRRGKWRRVTHTSKYNPNVYDGEISKLLCVSSTLFFQNTLGRQQTA